ncbi:MAG: adenylate/guanylate cyclase domain-containing protein [Gallionella sp.]|nr:adenylate/guanylate cyclase domain-containing protein [Gallionella sp.]
MLTSFEVMQAANISRATLNNYISQGLLPRPLVKNPEPGASTQARQLGYFPSEVLTRLKRIRQLKKDGYAMAEIARQLELDGFQIPEAPVQVLKTTHTPLPESAAESVAADKQDASQPAAPVQSSLLRLTIDHIPFPAYMVNYNFEITWYNEEARTELLGEFDRLPADIKERNALAYLLKGRLGRSGANREKLLQFYLLLGKGRLTRNDLMDVLTGQSDIPVMQTGESLAEARPGGTLMQLPLTLHLGNGEVARYNVYASYYREGILLIYQPSHDDSDNDSLLGLLERRDEVIRNLLKKHLPVLTDVAVLVADLQNSVRICTELPPEEYFELINQIWSTMEPIFRKYYGTHGKHVGDGMVYYFFPQPDCNYIFNALMCAQEMKATMRRISKEWQLRKSWLNELYLNTGLNEGQEWLGIFHIETKVEFTVLGDTINRAARLSDFARGGAIWATKNLLGKLPAEVRQRVQFGIRRHDADGREVFVGASYSRIAELENLNTSRNEKLGDIAALPVTEIMEIRV